MYLYIQSNLGIRNFLVTLKLFLNAKCSLSLWSKLTIGHGKWFLNTNLFLIKTFLITKFDCTKIYREFLNKISIFSSLCVASELLAGRVNHTLSLTSRCIFSFKKIGWAFHNCEQWILKCFSSQNKFHPFKNSNFFLNK